MSAAVAVVLTTAGCTPGENPGGRPSGSTSATPAPPGASAAAPEREALAAYRGMWNAYVEAAKTSDPDAADLRTYASDDALKLIVGALVTNREQKKVVLGELKTDPKVTSLTPAGAPTTAAITDCVDSTNWLEHKASGGLWDDKPGGRHRTTATVKLSAGSWKVTAFTLEGSGTC